MEALLSYIFNDEFVTMTIRIFLAALLSGLVGLEREFNRHPAGFRTHLLVGLGSCLMMLLSLYGFQPYLNDHENIRFDPARIPSYVISGIGFLGAGTILVKGATIKGLTTAASIWVVAGLGLIVGVGMFAPAILTTIVVLLSLIFLNKFETLVLNRSKKQYFHIVVKEGKSLINIIDVFESKKVKILNISLRYAKSKKRDVFRYTIEADFKRKEDKILLFEEIAKMEKVEKIF